MKQVFIFLIFIALSQIAFSDSYLSQTKTMNGVLLNDLYDAIAVNDASGLAPEGWHVPTDAEIMELEMYLGMSQQQANSTGLRGMYEGCKLAGGYDLWQNGVLRNDPEFGSSGFSFFPGGYRYGLNGNFGGLGGDGYFWTATEHSSSYLAWYRYLSYINAQVYRDLNYKRTGISVRCVKDVE